MTKEVCPACGCDKYKIESKVNGYVDGIYYEIASCFDCGSNWALPFVANNYVYDLIYKYKVDVPGYSRYSEYADEVKNKKNPLNYLARSEAMYYSVVRSIKKNVKKGGKILDVGCGLGYLSYSLSRAGYQALGIDISERAIEEAIKKYGDYFLCQDFFSIKNSDNSNLFDAVCMVELIEHVENPRQYIKHAINLLKPGGVIIITTPNKDWYCKRSVWDNELPPVHLTWFSEYGLKRCANFVENKQKEFSFFKYNLLNGHLTKPKYPQEIRMPIFNENGLPNFQKYTHSNFYFLCKRIRIYNFLNNMRNILFFVKDIYLVCIGERYFSFFKSNIQCLIIKK